MSRIHILPDGLINKIAAGEVVERPAAVVKELVENSLDAGADHIRVDVEEGGRTLIRVEDNGCGMNSDDALLALERHATSKLRELDDLEKISSLGFRGEALPAIASVSRMRLVTADDSGAAGTEIVVQGGTVQDVRVAARPKGTTLEVRDLFFNTPARRKFLKSRQTELSHITGVLTDIALAHPQVYVSFRHHDRTLIKAPAVSSLLERAGQLLGREWKHQLTDVEEGREGMHLFGLTSVPGFSKPSGTGLTFFVNRRPVLDRNLRHAVYDAYETLLMRRRHPVAYLFLDLDPALVDVNVHPTKREVRFSDARRIHDFVRDAVRKSVQEYGQKADRPMSMEPQTPDREHRVREAVKEYLRSPASGRARTEERSGRSFTGTLSPAVPAAGPESTPPVQALFEDTLVPIGQFADSFILSQDSDGLILIDQHAAHERVLYEKFKNAYAVSKIPVQRLLLPLNLELSHKDGILVREHIQTLNDLGIELEDFGHGTFTVKGVPSWVADTDIEELVPAMVQEISELEQTGELERRIGEVIHLYSCRAAVKARRSLSNEEMKALLKDLRATKSPHTCEHGRPTMIRIDLQEIEKRFQRR